MSALPDGLAAYGVILLIALVAHEPWRWLGLLLGRTVTVESEVFRWVRAVATALVAALVMRLVLFPAGALAGVPLTLRLAALAAGLAVFAVTRRSLGAGVSAGAVVLWGGVALSK